MFCAGLACYAAAFAHSAATITHAGRGAAAARVDAAAATTDGLLNYETVKCFTAEPHVQERVGIALVRSEIAWIGFYRRYAINGLVVSGIFEIGRASCRGRVFISVVGG